MIVVADTSPLNYLIRLGHSQVLCEIYGRVLAPNAVLTEMQHIESPPDVRAWAFSPPSWLEVVQVKQIDLSLNPELGAGEREAISLALERGANVLLIDERIGREQAEIRHLNVAGTLAVLLRASLQGHFDFPEEMKRLTQLGFRASGSIQAIMLERYHQATKHKR